MTRILGTADLHVGAQHITTLEEQEAALTAVADLAIEQKVAAVVIAGDATHHANPSAKALAVLGRFFGRLAEDKGIHVVVVSGNHDPLVPSVAENFRGRVHVALSPQIIRLGSVDIACLPYLPDSYVRAQAGGNASREDIARLLTAAAHEILRGFLAQRRPGVPLVLAAHGTLAGTETSSGWRLGFVGGTEWRIAIEDASEFDLTLAGHIHRHQSPAPNVVVPGSLLPLDFAETDAHGVITAWLPSEDGLAACDWQFVPIAGPHVRTFDVPHQEVTVPVLTSDAANYVDRGDKIRVRVTCSEQDAREYPPSRISTALYAAGASLVQVELTVTRPDRARNEAVTAEISPASALKEWSTQQTHLTDDEVLRIDRISGEVLAELGPSAGSKQSDLQLVSIEAQDFLGVHDARIEFDGHGVYAITGVVGVGKSTLGCDAPRFALYGASRYGAKVSDLLIRQGADTAAATVELQSATGDRYRVVRKLKRGSRGVTSTLDVLQHLEDARAHLDGAPTAIAGGMGSATWWRPLTDGKVASGQKVVDDILGGLTDETLTASSFVVQRAADAFTRARPEQRKALLAEAAGLSVYDHLAESSRAHLVEAERALVRQVAIAQPLRPRAAAVEPIESEITRARADVEECRGRVAQAETARDQVDEWIAAAQAELARHEDAKGTIKKLEAELSEINGEIATWDRRREIAQQILADRAKYEGAKTALAQMRKTVELLEGDQAREQDQQLAHDRAEYAVLEKTGRLDGLRSKRLNDASLLGGQIKDAEQRVEMLAAAECCAPEEVCVFLVDARAARDSITALEERLAPLSEPGDEEGVLVGEIINTTVPPAPTTYAETMKNLRFARERAAALEKDILIGEKIARAETVVAEHADAIASLHDRRNQRQLDLIGARVADGKHAAALHEVVALGEKRTVYGGQVQVERRTLTVLERDVAFAEGRLSEAVHARAELAEVDAAIVLAAADVAAWKQLVDAWKACRVAVLENSVIPSVEATANEVLRKFPYGMQLALKTQREKRSGDGVSEALEIDLIGGRAPTYEGCSGGQKTVVDVALHLAIALVVSRRASTRLRFVFLDEPEGLDEPGRAAMGGLCSWINREYGLTVLIASHASDLIEAVGGQRLEVVAGAEGSTLVVG